MRKAIAYGITFLLLCQVVGCGQAPAAATETETATETVAETQTVETAEAVAEESTEEASASELPESKVNEYGDIEEYEQHKYGIITRYIVKRDGMDQTEEHLEFENPIVIVDNDKLSISITDVFCVNASDNIVVVGYWFQTKNKSSRELCIVGTDEKLNGKPMDFPSGSGAYYISPGASEYTGEQSDELPGSDLTLEDMLSLEGRMQCDFKDDSGYFGGNTEYYEFSLKSALDKLN